MARGHQGIPPPAIEELARVEVTQDANGRIQNAELIETNPGGAELAVGSKEINDLGSVYREREIDQTTYRVIRDLLGKQLRTYVGTEDLDWINPVRSSGGYNMILRERTQYGSSVNDAWLPTVVRNYTGIPASNWDLDHHGEPPAIDPDGHAVVMSYDWRQRPVRTDIYAKGDPATSERLRTTLTYFDHGDRPYVVAEFGEGTLSLPASIDPVAAADSDPLPMIGSEVDISQLYACGIIPLSITHTLYDADGNSVEVREYNPAWQSGSGSPDYLATYTFIGRSGNVVYSQSPSSAVQLRQVDGQGRVVSDIDAVPGSGTTVDAAYQLTRTDYGYDSDGNITETAFWNRVSDLGNVLDSSNAVRTRKIAWYDPQKRMIAEAELGTEDTRGYFTGAIAPLAHDSSGTAPAYDPQANTVSRGTLPGTALLSTWTYHATSGNLIYKTDPAGVATEFTYGRADRLASKKENAGGTDSDVARTTQYKYELGRLATMTTPQHEKGSGVLLSPNEVETHVLHVHLPDYTSIQIDPLVDPSGYDAAVADENARVKSLNQEYNIVDEAFVPVSRTNSVVSEMRFRDAGNPSGTGDTGILSEGPDVKLLYTFDLLIAERRDARGIGFRYHYDDLRRLERIEVGYYDSSDSAWTSGYPSAVTSAWSAVIAASQPIQIDYRYDQRGNISEIKSFSAPVLDPWIETANIVSHIVRVHDLRGRVVEIFSEVGAAVTNTVPVNADLAYGWSLIPTSSDHPGADRLDIMEYASAGGRKIHFDYAQVGSTNDMLSRITSIAEEVPGQAINEIINFEFLGDGRRATESRAGGVIGRTILDSGAAEFAIPPGAVGVPGMDMFGRVREQHVRDARVIPETIFRSVLGWDQRSFVSWNDVATQTLLGSLDTSRSVVNTYDPLGRLTQSSVGALTPGLLTDSVRSIDTATVSRTDAWRLDSVGNWTDQSVADLDVDYDIDIFDSIAFLNGYNPELPSPLADIDDDGDNDVFDAILFLELFEDGIFGRLSVGDLDGGNQSRGHDAAGNAWHLPAASDTEDDSLALTQVPSTDNQVMSFAHFTPSATSAPVSELLLSTAPNTGMTTSGGFSYSPTYDAAGNFAEDGTYRYHYDAWNRLIAVERLVFGDHDGDGGTVTPAQVYVDSLARAYVYDAMGRLVQVTSYDDIGVAFRSERYTYDGIRRIAEHHTSDPDGPNPTEVLDREYIWGADGQFDEILVQFDSSGKGLYPIQDMSGNVVALVDPDPDGQPATPEAQVMAQWSYDAYGDIISAEYFAACPVQKIGHKGLFVDRLDEPYSQGEPSGSPRLIPFAHSLYHNRNRAYMPTYGRFLQKDPNATAMSLLSGSYHGRGSGAMSLAFSVETLHGDGMNLYEYLGSNPWSRYDPMGLSYDPFEMVDDYIAESNGNRVAFLSQIGQDAKAAALVMSTVSSYMPFPVVGELGDIALFMMGETSGDELAVALTLGLVPGGKLLQPLGKMLGGVASSAFKHAKHYAQFTGALAAKHLKVIDGGASRTIGTVASRAANLLRRKPSGCCFVAGTLVWTPAGAVPIVELESGDVVMSATDESVFDELVDGEVGAIPVFDCRWAAYRRCASTVSRYTVEYWYEYCGQVKGIHG